jgi:hypothetical protein
MISSNLDDITAAVLQRLVDNRVSERRTLEYKSSLPGGSDEDKREFLYDASSFANANGGDLVFGISEERVDGKPTGLPGAVAPINTTMLSTEMPRLENLLRDCVKPRIHGVEFRQVPFQDGQSVLVLRIPRSWNGPHMVTFRGGTRFYSRNAAGKHIMDVSELRTSFALSSSLPERLRAYRMERIAEIAVRIPDYTKIVLHCVPLTALDATSAQDFSTHAKKIRNSLMPGRASNWGGNFNFDGYAMYSTPPLFHTQLFRSGVMELVNTELTQQQSVPQHYGNLLPGTVFENEMIEAVQKCLDAQKVLGVPLPIFCLLSLIGVKGFTLGFDQLRIELGRIDRDSLLVPPLTIESFDVDVPAFLHPAFNSIWQASGAEGSLNYDSTGKRIRR